MTEDPDKTGESQAKRIRTSGNPGGCPSGSRPRFSVLCDRKVEAFSGPLINALVRAAGNGDMRAWKIIAERMWRPRKGRPIEIALPKVATLGDVLVAQARIVEAMSDGQISPDEASLMSTVLDAQRKAIETTELAEEIERIKERLEMDGRNDSAD
jgi:hypothetical protein